MDISFLGSSKKEIKNVNKGKVGAPFEYPHSKKITLCISLGFLAHNKRTQRDLVSK
jgi:hypothetical protein